MAIGGFIVYDGDPRALYQGPDGAHAIYALVDPIDNTVRYVGRTIETSARLSGHLREKDNYREAAWISRLLNADQKPIMVVLTRCETEGEAEAKENEVIDMYLDLGCDLYNRRINKRIHFGVSPTTHKEMKRLLLERDTTVSKLFEDFIKGGQSSNWSQEESNERSDKIEISKESFVYTTEVLEVITVDLYQKAFNWIDRFKRDDLEKLHRSLTMVVAAFKGATMRITERDQLDSQIMASVRRQNVLAAQLDREVVRQLRQSLT